MSNRFCVTLTHSKDDCDRATVAFVIANAALASEQETMVFLSIEGVRLSQQGYADDVHEEGFPPLAELIATFAECGGRIVVCSPCFNKRGLDPERLVPGAVLGGGATLVEFTAGGAACVSY